ncbi:hypothetical protein C0Q70_05968 [Pomacea canaliculata]|uniref:Transporter n=1 Tax=Pomacea canaliculata TaxID=400727 RepID=A0A2T7PMP6_POMCA|nr:sodium- and chloride-dependent glycine transporter 1-like [Pomacea canaliculata]XP_025086279.1 sodium- and chloride-dependent glycine transporter 1-like [Pomacea canaliculata]XP_025086280.1 sodium- and chloride-dependent glycine transporter 1-like [Pomacea canaliculata]XP_025086281.1 sodium- and chloride-dependent glycine transporter 1-like [Pomacea canaliculata]PVD34691.1 hypothetical protein C0Q70_05968 [Pomacea canaliculata]
MDTDSTNSSSVSSSNGLKPTQAQHERGGWGGKLDFILTCIGYAVGLGNIWRFPYLCYKSGGGAFFIPYTMFLLMCGLPLFFMEVSCGQFSSLSPVPIWKICPMFKGVGIGMVMVSSIVCIYYNVIIAWTIYYLFLSFRATLPWSTCKNEWNTQSCLDTSQLFAEEMSQNRTASNSSTLYALASILEVASPYPDMAANSSEQSAPLAISMAANLTAPSGRKAMSASEEFWQHHVLKLSSGIEELGEVRWQLLICLALSWLFVFLCLFKGVKILGKVMHFAAPFPYLVLTVLLIRGVTLPGAIDGIKFYIIPRFEELTKFQVWGDAALQIFYSVGMAWGGVITMASYNRFNNNAYRDAMIVPFVNCGTSVFAGFVIFSVLGFMAHEANSTVDQIVTQGPGLTFVAYPEAVSKMPIAPLWSILFFLMLFVVGLDSQFGMFETMLSSLIDEFPHLLRGRKTLLTAVTCFVEFLLGIPCICQGGIYVLQTMDWYCSSFSLMIISFVECVAISWIYGMDQFMKDIELMIGFKPCRFWTYMWKFVTPTVVLFIWVFSVTTLGPVTYGSYTYPTWAIIMGWTIGVSSMLPIPIYALYRLTGEKGSISERVRKLWTPAPDWGPKLPEHRKLYLASRGIMNMDSLEPLKKKSPDSFKGFVGQMQHEEV